MRSLVVASSKYPRKLAWETEVTSMAKYFIFRKENGIPAWPWIMYLVDANSRKILAFYIYSHPVVTLADVLNKHLRGLKRSKMSYIWADTRDIRTGKGKFTPSLRFGHPSFPPSKGRGFLTREIRTMNFARKRLLPMRKTRRK